MAQYDPMVIGTDDSAWQTAKRWAAAFLAGFQSAQTRRATGVTCTAGSTSARPTTCTLPGVRRTHLEVYLRYVDTLVPAPAAGTRYRRVATLSSWFRWLEDEDVTMGNPSARMRRPQRRRGPQPWLNRNQLTDLLAAAEDEGADAYALACLLGLDGLRVSEACAADVVDLGGSRYQPTLRIVGKGDKPAEVVLDPRAQQAVDQAVKGRHAGPLLRYQRRRPLQPHNAAAVVRRLARAAGIAHRGVTPHALRCSYITIGLLQGVPLRDIQRAARHSKADTTVGYDQSERSFHKDPTFVLMTATAR